MKILLSAKIRSDLSLVAALCLLIFLEGDHPCQAIPQTFSNPGQVILRAGKPFEEFLRDPTAWDPNSTIPGEGPLMENQSSLEEAGSIFGVNASSVQLARGTKSELTGASVRYDSSTAKLTSQKLHEQLAANIGAFAGVKAVNAQGKLRFVTRELVITLPSEAAKEIEVRISRVNAPPRSTAER